MPFLNSMNETNFAAGIPKEWAKFVIMDSYAEQFWSKMEGAEGSGMPIMRKDDPLKRASDTINFTVAPQLYGSGVTGNSTLEGFEQKITEVGFSLIPEIVRNAVSFNERAEGRALYKPSMLAAGLLKDWFSMRLDYDMDSQLINLEAPTPLFAGNATSNATLGNANVLTVDDIEKAHLELQRKGVKPFKITSSKETGGMEWPVYGMSMTEIDYFWLKQDARWREAQLIDFRGPDNSRFTGAPAMISGMAIFPRYSVVGTWGQPMRPETRIFGAHTAVVGTITVGNGDTTQEWTRHFPPTGTLSIVNSVGAREYCTYTGKTNATFTGVVRAATFNGTSVASAYVGGEAVTMNSHQSDIVAFGAQAACRSFVHDIQTITQERDYGFEQGVGLKATFGQRAYKDSLLNNKNYVVIRVKSRSPNASN